MGELGELDQHLRGIGAGVVLILEKRERVRDAAGHDGLEKLDHAGAVGDAEHGAQIFGQDLGPLPRRAIRHRLIEQRQRVAHRAFSRARDDGERVVLDLHILQRANLAQMLGEQAGIDAAQIEALATRAHRDRHLLDLGRREKKFHMLRRLLQRLQQAVEGRLREHVHFVDDVDLHARHDRAIARIVDDLAHVVDARVRGRIHLQHVGVARLHDRLAVDADLVHLDRRAVDGGPAVLGGELVIESARQDARGRGLADAANPREQIGLMNALEPKGVFERSHHRLLADEVGKARRPIFAREHAIGRGAEGLGRARRPSADLARWRIATRTRSL